MLEINLRRKEGKNNLREDLPKEKVVSTLPEWLLDMGKEKDITINLRHIMDFGKDRFDIHIQNADQIVHSMKELVPIAGMIVR